MRSKFTMKMDEGCDWIIGDSLSLGKFRAERNGLSFGPRGLGNIISIEPREPNERVR